MFLLHKQPLSERNTTPFPFSTLILFVFVKKMDLGAFMTFWLLECSFSRHLSGDIKFFEYSSKKVSGSARWLMLIVALDVQPCLACVASYWTVWENNDADLLSWGWRMKWLKSISQNEKLQLVNCTVESKATQRWVRRNLTSRGHSSAYRESNAEGKQSKRTRHEKLTME